jgi:hypothetical protein
MSMAIVCYGTVYQRTINTNNIYLLTVLLTMPESKCWAVCCLFLLVLTTGNAIVERGFSAMSNVHTKSRRQLSVS